MCCRCEPGGNLSPLDCERHDAPTDREQPDHNHGDPETGGFYPKMLTLLLQSNRLQSAVSAPLPESVASLKQKAALGPSVASMAN